MNKTTLIGSGSYGKIYMIDKTIALKCIENTEDGMAELSEVNLLKKFDHPNILKRFDELFIIGNEIGITLPLASGDLVIATKAGVSDIKKQQWVYELLSGIHCIHKNGYYHGDIKPQNVLIISDKAVIADPGLMGLQIYNLEIDETVQSLACPQLLYKRANPNDKKLMTHPIYQKRCTSIQSDLWALGETIYFIANCMYPIGNTIKFMNLYIETNTLYIQGLFHTIITTLLNPDPDELINLTVLLEEEPFNGLYTEYIYGTINKHIHNKNPVVFTPELKNHFHILFSWIIKICHIFKTDSIVIFNTIDMFYLIFNIIKDPSFYQMFICACLTLSGKIYGKFISPKNINVITTRAVTVEQLLESEKLIVQFLGGILDRDLPLFYGVSVDKFEKWIVDNPEKYEQFDMTRLVCEINTVL